MPKGHCKCLLTLYVDLLVELNEATEYAVLIENVL